MIPNKAERAQLVDSITAGARAVHFSNATIEWFLGSATPGQMQAVDGMLRHEAEVRRRNRHARLLRRAKFPAVKSVEDFDYSDLRFPDGYGWDDMLSLEWVDKHQDFLFHGPTGRGKSHLAVALGMRAIDAGRPVRFVTAAQLVLELKRALEEGRLDEAYADYGKDSILIIDEMGYIPLDAEGGRLLFQVMSNCYERQSMIITTNIEFSKWGTVLADEKLASALVDRVAHHGRLVEFGGKSRRVIDSLMLGNRKEA